MSTADPSTPDAPVDPFDLEALREAPPDIAVERVLLTVPVRKPNKTEFFRVHSQPEYTIDAPIMERAEEGFGGEAYWVSPQLRDALALDLVLVRLFTVVSRRGVVFLWPVKLPGSDQAGRRWRESALEIAEAAQTTWVKMQASRDLGAYEMSRARGDLGEPKWPDKTFRELVEIAFKGRIVDRPDHDLIRELTGEF